MILQRRRLAGGNTLVPRSSPCDRSVEVRSGVVAIRREADHARQAHTDRTSMGPVFRFFGSCQLSAEANNKNQRTTDHGPRTIAFNREALAERAHIATQRNWTANQPCYINPQAIPKSPRLLHHAGSKQPTNYSPIRPPQRAKPNHFCNRKSTYPRVSKLKTQPTSLPHHCQPIRTQARIS